MDFKKITISKDFRGDKKSVSYLFSKTTSIVFIILFLCNLSYLLFGLNHKSWFFLNAFRINGFTLLIWALVTFFSAIVNSYSANYLKGFKHHNRFTLLCIFFTLSVMVLVASDHIVALLISWFLMGFFMSKLIGVDTEKMESKSASAFAQIFFLISSLLLSVGLLLLAYTSGIYRISEIISNLKNFSNSILFISAILIITAAIIQSAIYPFHRWLLSAMTAPTPASALMHAGFVNGSGILLTIFASLMVNTDTLTLLFILGGITAILSQFTKLLQVSVKQKLACSTIAQMGFMIMQCGLGFFNAAVAHLILHGFYKAYLFLSSGDGIKASIPVKPIKIHINLTQAIIVGIAGVIGAYLFANITGKGTTLNSGIFLTLIVAITVGQATYNIVKQTSLSQTKKFLLSIILFPLAIGSYGLIYNWVTNILSDMPFSEVPSPLSIVQISFCAIFLLGFFIMKLEIYKKIPWLYVKLLNLSQPYKKTILMSKKISL